MVCRDGMKASMSVAGHTVSTVRRLGEMSTGIQVSPFTVLLTELGTSDHWMVPSTIRVSLIPWFNLSGNIFKDVSVL